MSAPELDIVIPVYNEGENIVATLTGLARHVATPHRVLICYDRDEDDTLPAIRKSFGEAGHIVFVKNEGRGAHGAVLTGFKAAIAPYVLVFPADDDYNAEMLDRLVAKARDGAAIVCASRFMKGGSMVGCPWLKAVLVRCANFTLRHIAGLPTHDASNGFRLFALPLLRAIPIRSVRGFTYSIELLVKTHRLGWPVAEVPAQWFEREAGQSRFRVLSWLPDYIEWYGYAFATRFLGRRDVEGVEATTSWHNIR